MTKGAASRPVPGTGDDRLAEHLLVLRAQLGDRAAYGALFDRYHARLLRYVQHRVGSAADAEDVLQDVWITVIRKLAALENPQAFRVWLYRVAQTRAISRLRRKPRELSIDAGAIELELATADEPEEEADGVLARYDDQAVHAGLALLSPAHREALTLRYFEGFTYQEIAEIIGCEIGTVRSRMHYAKKALQQRLTVPSDPPSHREI